MVFYTLVHSYNLDFPSALYDKQLKDVLVERNMNVGKKYKKPLKTKFI